MGWILSGEIKPTTMIVETKKLGRVVVTIRNYRDVVNALSGEEQARVRALVRKQLGVDC